MINDVGPTGVALLQTLYPLPPASNSGDSDSKRLARSITLYMATGFILAPQSPAPTHPLRTGAVINTARTSPPRAAAATTPAPASPGFTQRHPIALGFPPQAQVADDAR